MRTERLNRTQSFILLLIMGVVLTFIRWIFLLFPASFLFDALLYGLAGYVLGNHLYYGKWRWGFVLAAPVMLAILYFFITATEAASATDIGLKNILSFILIPVSACAGIWLKNHRAIQHH